MSKKAYKRIEYLAHLIFWAGIIMLFIYPLSNHNLIVETSGGESKTINQEGVQWVIYTMSALIFYLNIVLLRPLLFRRKQYSLYLLVIAGIMALILTLEYYFFFDSFMPLTSKFLRESAINHAIFLVFSFLYIFVRHHLSMVQEKRVIEMEKLSSELSLLRAQLNPHFLFNAINNIFSVAQKNGDEEVAKHIANLSRTLRYSLYENNEEQVALSREIEFLESYVQMSLLKYEEDALHFDFKKEILNSEIKVVPLILMPLVENAFKHVSGISPFIAIKVVSDENVLRLVVTNSIGKTLNKGLPSTGGIGLENLKRRLQLLYPDLHELILNKKEEVFGANLKIQINGK